MIKASLRNHLLEEIDKFLKSEGLTSDASMIEGILMLVSVVSDYYEEGKRLYPEIVITNNMDIFKTLPARVMSIQSAPLNPTSFRHAIKLCAPLSVDGWVIYLEIADDKVNFGMVSTEMTETSLSLRKQTSFQDTFQEGDSYVHISCAGDKIVRLQGLKDNLQISLNLDDDDYHADNTIQKLSEIIVSGCPEEYKDKLSVYFEKFMDNTLKIGHGNLIGVVEDNSGSIEAVKDRLKDGVYIDSPIDMSLLVMQAESEKSNLSSMQLRSYSSLASSMINHDGITLITTTGRILGYHLFVKDNMVPGEVVGGARSRAFESMKSLGLKACFYKSQDGNINLYVNE